MHDTTADADAQHRRRWWALGVLGLAQLMVVLDATIVNIALPSAQHALGFSNADRQWVVTAYSLAFGGLLLLGGRLADLLGRRLVFIAGLVGFAGASAVGGAATGFGMLVAARGAQGAFGALLAPAALSLLSTTFADPDERGKAFGIYGAIAGAGGALGLLLGGLLTEYLDWRWCLYVNVAFAVLAVIGAFALLSNQSRRPDAQLDIPGTVTVVAGLVALVYGFSEANSRGWLDGVTLGLLAGSVVLLSLFVVIERRVTRPLLPLRVVLDRTRGASYLAIAFAAIASFGVFLFLTYYLQQTLHFSPLRTGVGFLPLVAGIITSSQLASNLLLPRLGARVLVPLGMVSGAAGMAWLTRITLHTSYGTGIVPGLVLVGLGMGLIFACGLNLATAGADPADAGVASAMVNTMQQVGGSIGTALLNTLAASATARYIAVRHGQPPAVAAGLVHGDVVAFTVVVGIFLLGAVVTAAVYRSGPPLRVEGSEPVLAAG